MSTTANRTLDPFTNTVDPNVEEGARKDGPYPVPRVEILFHYDLSRIGLVTASEGLLNGLRGVAIGRDAPEFIQPSECSRSSVMGRGVRRWTLGDPCISRNQLAIWWKDRSQRFEVQPNPKAKLKTWLVEWHRKSDVIGGAELIEITERTLLEPGSMVAIGNRCLLMLSRKALPPFDSGHLNLVGNSEVVWSLRERVRTLAKFRETVLILGETGAGKELIARGLHETSGRKGKFVALNMGSMEANLAKSELFGHKRGAFTGADKDKTGAFEEARGGTLFLDEIGDVPMDVQRMLLRVLQNHQFTPLGATSSIDADVRVVAATNKQLRAAIDGGEFRLDLFERLRQLAITVPPLRGHRSDIPLLFTHFLAEQTRLHPELLWLWADRVQPDAPPVPLSFVLDLMARPWNGNARELQNVVAATAAANIESSVFQAPDPVVDMPSSERLPSPTPWPVQGGPSKNTPPKEMSPEELRRLYKECNYNQARLAQYLAISRPTVIDWLGKADIRRAVDYSAEEILAVMDEVDGDVAAAADRLSTSARALKLQLSRLDYSA